LKFINVVYLTKPRGGVASLLAQSYIKSLDELRAESVEVFFFFC
jgi:hypothetical protein